MNNVESINRLDSRLKQLVESMIKSREAQIDFFVGLNRLDDILISQSEGLDVNHDIAGFFRDYRHWLEKNALSQRQKERLSLFLSRLHQDLLGRDDGDSLKLVEEVREWMRLMGNGSFRLTIKSNKEQASLADRFYSLLHRESQELNILLMENEHLLTCLEDIIKSAEAKTDRMYEHLAASLIYFMQMEGYKVDPYVKMLQKIRQTRRAKS